MPSSPAAIDPEPEQTDRIPTSRLPQYSTHEEHFHRQLPPCTPLNIFQQAPLQGGLPQRPTSNLEDPRRLRIAYGFEPGFGLLGHGNPRFPRLNYISTPAHVEAHLAFWAEEQKRQGRLLRDGPDPLSRDLRAYHDSLIRDTLNYLGDLQDTPQRLCVSSTLLELGRMQNTWDAFLARVKQHVEPDALPGRSTQSVPTPTYTNDSYAQPNRPEMIDPRPPGARVIGLGLGLGLSMEARLPSFHELMDSANLIDEDKAMEYGSEQQLLCFICGGNGRPRRHKLLVAAMAECICPEVHEEARRCYFRDNRR